MIRFQICAKKWSPEMLGMIPEFLTFLDARPAAQQFHENYSHGGGWSPMQGWKHLGRYKIYYPGDRAMLPVAKAKFRDEMICVYEHAWVGIFQPDGSFEISRMD